MKVFVFALAVLAVGASAGPQDRSEARFVEGIISGLIEDVSQNIRDAGLDPIARESQNVYFRPFPTDLLVAEAALANLYVEGLSNIVINSINFSLFSSRVDLDIELPRISANIESSASVQLFDRQTSGSLGGYVNVLGIRVRGRISVRISIINGISVSGVNINFTLRGIESGVRLVIHEVDLSDNVNYILGEYIPNVIYSFSNDINALLEHYVREIIENNL